MKTLPALVFLFTCFSSPLWSIVIKTQNDFSLLDEGIRLGGGLGGTISSGVVEVITEPKPSFDLNGKPIQNRFGQIVHDDWDVLMRVENEQNLDFPGEETIWLHAKLPLFTQSLQFIGWEGIDDKFTNPVEVTLAEVESITANFELKPGGPFQLLPIPPAESSTSVWVQSSGQGFVELITAPSIVFGEESGKPTRDERGYIGKDWDVLMTIDSLKEIDLPNE